NHEFAVPRIELLAEKSAFESSERMRPQYLDQIAPITRLWHIERHILKGNPAGLVAARLDSIDAALPKRLIDDDEGDPAEALLRVVQHFVRGNPYLRLLIRKLRLIWASIIVEFAAPFFSSSRLVSAACLGDVLAALLRPAEAFQVDAHLRAIFLGQSHVLRIRVIGTAPAIDLCAHSKIAEQIFDVIAQFMPRY